MPIGYEKPQAPFADRKPSFFKPATSLPNDQSAQSRKDGIASLLRCVAQNGGWGRRAASNAGTMGNTRFQSKTWAPRRLKEEMGREGENNGLDFSQMTILSKAAGRNISEESLDKFS